MKRLQFDFAMFRESIGCFGGVAVRQEGPWFSLTLVHCACTTAWIDRLILQDTMLSALNSRLQDTEHVLNTTITRFNDVYKAARLGKMEKDPIDRGKGQVALAVEPGRFAFFALHRLGCRSKGMRASKTRNM